MASIILGDAEFKQQLQAALRRNFESIGYTNVQIVRLGNGDNNNPVVRVPNKAGFVYVHTQTDDNREVFIVRDNGLVPFDNRSANMEVKIGYPPTESRETGGLLTIFEFVGNPSGFNAGISGLQRELAQLKYVTPQRYGFMVIRPVTGLTIKLIGGFARYGNQTVIVPTGVTIDLSSLVPSDPNRARFVGVYWNAVQETVQLESGVLFAITSSSDVVTRIPLSIPNNCLRMGFVYLQNGMAQIASNNLVQAPDLFHIPIVGTVVTPSTALTNSNGDNLTNSNGDLLTT